MDNAGFIKEIEKATGDLRALFGGGGVPASRL
jgi:hypothetical protein